MNQHLTTDQLVENLYCSTLDGHLEDCPACTARLRELIARRAEVTGAPAASYEMLAAQRRNIYARMGERPQAARKWIPALAAAACLLAAGVFAYHPQVPTPKSELVDAQLFSDVYSIEQSTEPLAAQPIHALFEQE